MTRDSIEFTEHISKKNMIDKETSSLSLTTESEEAFKIYNIGLFIVA